MPLWKSEACLCAHWKHALSRALAVRRDDVRCTADCHSMATTSSGTPRYSLGRRSNNSTVLCQAETRRPQQTLQLQQTTLSFSLRGLSVVTSQHQPSDDDLILYDTYPCTDHNAMSHRFCTHPCEALSPPECRAWILRSASLHAMSSEGRLFCKTGHARRFARVLDACILLY